MSCFKTFKRAVVGYVLLLTTVAVHAQKGAAKSADTTLKTWPIDKPSVTTFGNIQTARRQ